MRYHYIFVKWLKRLVILLAKMQSNWGCKEVRLSHSLKSETRLLHTHMRVPHTHTAARYHCADHQQQHHVGTYDNEKSQAPVQPAEV